MSIWTTDALKAKRDLYADRKARQVCVFCEAGLQEDDGVLCVECAERQRPLLRKYASRPEARARKRELEQQRLAAGLCVHCYSPRAPGNAQLCERHRRDTVLRQRRSRERKRMVAAGVLVLPAANTGAKNKGLVEIRKYQPLDELKQSSRVRILLALSWHEWIAARDLFATLAVDFSDSAKNAEYDTYTTMLCRLVRHGFVERRGRALSAEYQITEMGRAESARYRSGDFRRRERRAA